MDDLRERLGRRTPLVAGVLGVICAVHVALAWLSLRLAGRPPGLSDWDLAIHPALLERFGAAGPAIFERGEAWRLLGSAFLHGNLVHLVLNGVSLWSVGRFTERLFGAGPLALVLVLGAVAGSLAAAVPGEQAVGASGAIVAVAGLLATGLRGPRLPPGLAAVIRRRIFVIIGLMLALGAAANFAFERMGAPVRISNAAHVAGFLAGLALGAAVPAPLVEASPLRRRLLGAATGAAVLGALGLLGQGALDILGSLDRSSTAAFRADVLVPGRLHRAAVPSLGFELGLPADWVDLRIDPTRAFFGPMPGAPLVQVYRDPRPFPDGPGAPPDPGPVVAGRLADLRRRGATEIVVPPVLPESVGGRPAWRIELRYRTREGDLVQEVRYTVRAHGRAYAFVFIGPDRTAEVVAERLIPGIRFMAEDRS